jgi:hypothetical protein
MNKVSAKNQTTRLETLDVKSSERDTRAMLKIALIPIPKAPKNQRLDT